MSLRVAFAGPSLSLDQLGNAQVLIVDPLHRVDRQDHDLRHLQRADGGADGHLLKVLLNPSAAA